MRVANGQVLRLVARFRLSKLLFLPKDVSKDAVYQSAGAFANVLLREIYSLIHGRIVCRIKKQQLIDPYSQDLSEGGLKAIDLAAIELRQHEIEISSPPGDARDVLQRLSCLSPAVSRASGLTLLVVDSDISPALLYPEKTP
jgi:hypothetical protein